MQLKGKVCVDKKTKNLTKRVQPGEIAVINHPDLDEIAAKALVESKVKAVINAAPSITGKYPNQGPGILLQAGIPLIDNAGKEIMDLRDGENLSICNNNIFHHNNLLATGVVMTKELLEKQLDLTQENMEDELIKFVDNTLIHAFKEKDIILNNKLIYPLLKTKLEGKQAVVVVRGKNYKEDLSAIRPYLSEIKPILIAVDGGADALLDLGFKPDLIVGDMDSISDSALLCGGELIVHAYLSGKAPGIERLKKMGLEYTLIPVPGTSEDAAMLLADAKGAELIVAVGTHSNMIDFLEKGRPGMASTLLVRIKVGQKLIDAKGVSKLYKPKLYFGHLAQVLVAGLIPIFIFSSISPVFNQFWRILILKIRLLVRI
ncbi:MAG: putative cytokinetic ring protein SteA [Bacillota bacterium]